jgi:hypothetical protein
MSKNAESLAGARPLTIVSQIKRLTVRDLFIKRVRSPCLVCYGRALGIDTGSPARQIQSKFRTYNAKPRGDEYANV